ncbi:MAG: polyphosphate kinase 2 [Salibacteraceae bacterium]|jgi:polyphosphate kinase 2
MQFTFNFSHKKIKFTFHRFVKRLTFEIESIRMKTKITKDEFQSLTSKEELLELIQHKKISIHKIEKSIAYEKELKLLQIELVKLQQWIVKSNKKVMIIFEGRDAAGKGGAIRRFVEHLNPRSMRVVALSKPTEIEQGQWYFRRFVKELPQPGEIVFFDRSWYNRAVVEPVMGFCTKKQYATFLMQVPEFEQMLIEDGVKIIKVWFSIEKEEQLARFTSRKTDPLKLWKISPVDELGQELWDKYSHYKKEMFSKSHTMVAPWTIIQANNKKIARLESIRHVLSTFNYDGKEEAEIHLHPDPSIVMRYQRLLHLSK